MRKIKKLVATLLAATMLLAMGVTAFAATPTTCKFTKADGSALKMNMDVGMIDSADLDEDGMATVTFKTYSLLWYKGSIANITGEAVESFNPTTGVAVIDTTYDDGTGLAGVPVNLTFSFNMTPPGMSNTMDARFVCE